MMVTVDLTGKKISEVIDIVEELDLADGYTIGRNSDGIIVLEYDDEKKPAEHKRRRANGRKRK